MTSNTALLVTAFAAMLTGCGTMVQSSPPTAGAQGLVYALPKGQVQVLASRRQVAIEELAGARKLLANAEAAAAAADAKRKARDARRAEAAVTSEAADTRAKGPKATDADRAIASQLARDAALATLLHTLAEAEQKQLEVTVAKARNAVGLLDGQVGKWVESVAVNVLPNVPDQTHRFILRHIDSYSRDDKLKFEVVNGLLSNSTSETTGQVSSILLNLARVSGTQPQLRTGTLSFQATDIGTAAAPAACQPYSIDTRFDPSNSADVERARDALKVSGLGLTLDPSPQTGTQASGAGDHHDGLVYRAEAVVSVTVKVLDRDESRSGCGAPSGSSAATVSGLFPDATTRFVLPIKGAAFAKVSSKYTFKNGIPVSAEIDRPSQLVAITALPVDILKALIAVPAELIKLRVDYSSQAAAQAEAQVREAKAQQELLKALEDLEAARSTKAP